MKLLTGPNLASNVTATRERPRIMGTVEHAVKTVKILTTFFSPMFPGCNALKLARSKRVSKAEMSLEIVKPVNFISPNSFYDVTFLL